MVPPPFAGSTKHFSVSQKKDSKDAGILTDTFLLILPFSNLPFLCQAL